MILHVSNYDQDNRMQMDRTIVNETYKDIPEHENASRICRKYSISPEAFMHILNKLGREYPVKVVNGKFKKIITKRMTRRY